MSAMLYNSVFCIKYNMHYACMAIGRNNIVRYVHIAYCMLVTPLLLLN